MAEEKLTLVEMTVRPSGADSEWRWFTYMVNYYDAPLTVKWWHTTNLAILPTEVASYLVRNKYARLATQEELERYRDTQPNQEPPS